MTPFVGFCILCALPHIAIAKNPKIEFEAVGDRVIVKVSEEEQKTASGILVTVRDAVNKDLPQCGEVVALGKGGTFPECPDPTTVFKLGDFVYFNRYAGEEIILGNPFDKSTQTKLIVLRLDAVFGKLIRAK